MEYLLATLFIIFVLFCFAFFGYRLGTSCDNENKSENNKDNSDREDEEDI